MPAGQRANPFATRICPALVNPLGERLLSSAYAFAIKGRTVRAAPTVARSNPWLLSPIVTDNNLDDHPRNHALIARNLDWALAPAYDLTPSPAVSLDHRDLALVCGDQGRFANAKNLLSQHARFLLPKDEAEKIIADTRQQVGRWYDLVRACGVSENDAETIRGAFLYPGFSY